MELSKSLRQPVIKKSERKTMGMSRRFVSLVGAAVVVLASCGGGSSTKSEADAVVVSGMAIQSHSFSFANFGASGTELSFDETDLVAMFGGSDGVCVDGKTNPCVPVAEAAIWARMVNQARQSGHCEGFAVLASSRFENNESPATALLKNEGDVTHGLMRAFATQFLPEVQEETIKWQQTAPSLLIEQLEDAFKSKKVSYSMGIYSDTGGHAVLPYALTYLDNDIARVMVYDSNWPGAERYVDVNLKDETWEFSYSGTDPVSDAQKWTGGIGDIDLTSMDSRVNAKCPFCGTGTGIAKTILVLRSANPDWSISTPEGVIAPGQPDTIDGSTRPLKQAEGDAAPVDYVIVLNSQSSATFSLPSASKVVGVTPSAALEFSTPGSGTDSNSGVVVGESGISSNDAGIVLTLATGNLVATANGQTAQLESNSEGIAVSVATTSGEQIELKVTDSAPSVEVRTSGIAGLASGVNYEIATQTGTNEITREVVSESGRKSTVVEQGSLGANSTEVALPEVLQSTEVSSALPPLEERTFDEATRVRNALIETTTTAPAAAPTAPSTTTTVKPRPTTTTVPFTTTTTATTVPATTTTSITTTTTIAQSPSVTAAAPWVLQTTAPGDTQARDLVVGSDGHSYAMGSFCNSSVTIGSTTINGANVAGEAHCNISVSKISAQGSVVWAKAIKGSGEQNWGDYIDVDSNGNVYVVGFFNGATLESGSIVLNDLDASSAVENQFVMKFNSSGVPQWGTVLGKTKYADIAVSNDSVFVSGNIMGSGTAVVFGSTTLTSVSTRDLFVTRMNPLDGSFMWATLYGTSTPTQFSTVDIDPTGNLLVTGEFVGPTLQFGSLAPLNNASTGTSDVFVVKINSSGTPVWSLRVGGAGSEGAGYLDSSSQEVIFTSFLYGSSANYGSTTLTRTVVTDTRALVVTKVSTSGVVTNAFVAADGDVWGGSVVIDNTGGIYLSGIFQGSSVFRDTTRTSVGNYDAFVTKISSSGVLQWMRTIGNTDTNYYSLVALAAGGGVIWNIDNSGSSSLTIGSSVKQLDDLDSFVIHIAADGTMP